MGGMIFGVSNKREREMSVRSDICGRDQLVAK